MTISLHSRNDSRGDIQTEQINYPLYFKIQKGNFENSIGMFSGFQKNHWSDTLLVLPMALEFFTSELGSNTGYIRRREFLLLI